MSKNLATYSDIREVLDQVLASGDGSFILATHNDAIAWRLRAYKFRKLFYDQTSNPKYHKIVFPRIEPGSCEVRMELRKQKGVLVLDAKAPLPEGSLDSIAEDLAKRLNKGDIL